MKYIKKFEDVNKKLYPFDDFTPFINWFGVMYEDVMKNEGWLISDSSFDSSNFIRPVFQGKLLGGYWQVQRNDEDEIIETDIVAEKLAKKHGLLLDNDGVVVGYNDVSFIEHPEELVIYKDYSKYNI